MTKKKEQVQKEGGSKLFKLKEFLYFFCYFLFILYFFVEFYLTQYFNITIGLYIALLFLLSLISYKILGWFVK